MKSKILVGLAAATLGLFMASSTVLAYTVGSGSSGTTSVTSPQGGVAFTAAFTFKDSGGAPISGTVVTFSATGPCAGTTFSPASGTTDANGYVQTSVTLPVNCPGSFSLIGTLAGGGSVSVSVTEPGGFPNTSALPANMPIWAMTLVGVGVLVVLAALISLRRERRIGSVAR
jgi:hypothetical protein